MSLPYLNHHRTVPNHLNRYNSIPTNLQSNFLILKPLQPDISNLQTRGYLTERVLQHTYSKLVKSNSLVLIPSEKKKLISQETLVSRVRDVPVYSLLDVICMEWLRVPLDMKLTAVKVEHNTICDMLTHLTHLTHYNTHLTNYRVHNHLIISKD